MATKVLSIRLPEESIKELKLYCKAQGTTPSAFVRDKFTDIGQCKLFEEGGEVVETEFCDYLLGLAGGSTVGILVYKAVKGKLTSIGGDYTDAKIETYSVVSGVVSALLAGYGIIKLMQLLDD